jgi:Calcineurin-like phosphoesterase/RTX calcium-binding nonapeptide repeat (4 copies)
MQYFGYDSRPVTKRRLISPLVAVLVLLPAPGVGPAGAASKPKCQDRVATIVGTKGNDVLHGTKKRDVIAGLAGNDIIRGLGAADRICGGSGHDRLYGGRGNDRLSGNTGNDSLFGEPGKDVILGGIGDDGCLDGGGGGKKRSCLNVVAAAGDIACEPGQPMTATGCRHGPVSDQLISMGIVGLLPLGDIQYEDGALAKFQASYHPTWGRLNDIVHPAVGNHEYLTPGAAGYFSYFGAVAGSPGAGYYSYNLDRWHVIVLNSECTDAGGCTPGTPQYQWLAADLAANPTACTLAYWHIPLFSSGGRAAPNTRHLYQLLYDNKADLILTGHDHIYERFAPQNHFGVRDDVLGIRQFVVGTGGSNHTLIPSVAPNSEVRDNTTFGALKLTLRNSSYDWQFVPEPGSGSFTDSGSTACH